MKYVSPEIHIESLKTDANFAMGCGSSVTYNAVACLAASAPDDYEILVDVWGLPPDAPLSSAELQNILYSNSLTCQASCYQGPFDTFFSS